MRMSSKLTPCRRLHVAFPMLVSLLLFSFLSDPYQTPAARRFQVPRPRRGTVHQVAHALETAPLRGWAAGSRHQESPAGPPITSKARPSGFAAAAWSAPEFAPIPLWSEADLDALLLAALLDLARATKTRQCGSMSGGCSSQSPVTVSRGVDLPKEKAGCW